MSWKPPLLLLTLLVLGCGGGGGGGTGPRTHPGQPPPQQPPPEPPPGSPNVFIVKPYLQVGEDRTSQDRVTLLWHAQDGAGQWHVEWRPDAAHA